jgi:hypothetical protein
LFLTWQAREAGMYFPVGRLVERGEAPRYEFAYIRGVNEARQHGFAPLSGLSDLQRVYRSEELHPVFENRLMPKSRPDFLEYVRGIGLDVDLARPIEILGRGAGKSATDRMELFSPPAFDSGRGTWNYIFPVRGIRYVRHAEARIAELRPGDQLYCMPDVQNPHDPNAVALRTTDHTLVGHVPRYLSEDVSQLLALGADMPISVLRVNPPPFPAQLRMFCAWEVEAVEGFAPFSTDDYQPIAPEATNLEWDVHRLAG